MKKSRGKNPTFLILSLLVPWRFINTWYYLLEGTLFISRYYVNEKSRTFKKELLEIDVENIDKIGFSGDFGNQPIEPMIQGYYGSYKS
ncbi:hypothetical protein [Candidatus Enterococcus lemimoniae]|uniref:Uncharacterized protein n=1 Tax=Candidatus Enterococcus lemimoniae TaxID=1834167 RepID=A0ABZ2T0T9_9ENTE|nr:hypothetical protein [Enterococcus sp. 12C11_DIV0727]OTO69750.1 hypothetical protein A5866_001966 [Enterococcus sp. 12C11_DIV0727]